MCTYCHGTGIMQIGFITMPCPYCRGKLNLGQPEIGEESYNHREEADRYAAMNCNANNKTSP